VFTQSSDQPIEVYTTFMQKEITFMENFPNCPEEARFS